MDMVLGVSMAPASVRMVLLQGENADGATVDESEFTTAEDSPTASASDRVIAAIVGTREDAASAGLELDSIGVACTDQLEAAAIRDALAAHKIENVLLVSAFLAATALTQSVGGAMGYERTAMLFLEPDTATLAVVETSDGSVDDIHEAQLNGQIVTAELMEMVAGLAELPTHPGGLFVVGSGVDLASIKSLMEEATSLTVNVPEEPETALARGAALASAHALASPTGVLAYAQDPGTGAVDVSALPDYLSVPHDGLGEDDVAYSAVADDEANARTAVIGAEPRRRPGLLVGTALAVATFGAAVALEIALSLGIRTTVGSLPAPLQDILAPVQQVLAPAPGQVAATKVAAPKPLSPPPSVPPPAAPVPAAPPVPLPAAPAPPVPAAVPVPLVVPPIAPPPLPPVHLPNPPVSPPVVEPPTHPSPPAEPPPVHAPPPKSPPPHRLPPGQGPPPNSGGGGPGPVRGNPGAGGPHGGGPVDGPGPGHGVPGGGPPEGGTPPRGGGPHGGGPVDGPGPGHGALGGGPPEGGTPPSDSGPHGGGETPGAGGPVGGGSESHSGGGDDAGGSHGGGGGEVGGSSSSGGGSSSGGSSSSGGESGGSSSSSSGSSSSGGESGGGHR
jgi:hypothetical protein